MSILLGLTGCSRPVYEEDRLARISAFQMAVEQNQPSLAHAFLTRNAQRAVTPDAFAHTNGDWQTVLDVFKLAQIAQPPARETYKSDIFVDKLRGRDGVVRFVLVQEQGQLRIVNILEP